MASSLTALLSPRQHTCVGALILTAAVIAPKSQPPHARGARPTALILNCIAFLAAPMQLRNTTVFTLGDKNETVLIAEYKNTGRVAISLCEVLFSRFIQMTMCYCVACVLYFSRAIV